MPILGPQLGNLKGYYCLGGTSDGSISLPGVVVLLLPPLLLIGVDTWGRCHLWALGKGQTNPKPVAGPELMFSASVLTQRELPISSGNISVESAQKTWASLCRWWCYPGALEEMVWRSSITKGALRRSSDSEVSFSPWTQVGQRGAASDNVFQHFAAFFLYLIVALLLLQHSKLETNPPPSQALSLGTPAFPREWYHSLRMWSYPLITCLEAHHLSLISFFLQMLLHAFPLWFQPGHSTTRSQKM